MFALQKSENNSSRLSLSHTQDNRDGTCLVEYYASEAGEYDLTIKFADQHIPGSPFRIRIDDVGGGSGGGLVDGVSSSNQMNAYNNYSSNSSRRYNTEQQQHMATTNNGTATHQKENQMEASYSYSYGRKVEVKNSVGSESPQMIHSSAQYDSNSNRRHIK